MKKIVLIALLWMAQIALQAQAPQGINYQAAVRDNAGSILANQLVSLRLAILQGNPLGPTVYQETHDVTTSAVGIANLVIGTGTVSAGSFSTLNWSAGPYFLQVELAVNAGAFQMMGTSQFVSVPYALYAEHSGDKIKAGHGITISNDSIHSSWTYSGNNVVSNNSGNVGIGIVPNNQKLEVGGGILLGNTANNAQGSIRYNGADFEGATGAGWKSLTKSSLENFEYINPDGHNISSTIRNSLVILNTDSLVVPVTGTYLIIYSGRGNNTGYYDVTNTGLYDAEGLAGVVNVTNNPNAFVANHYGQMFLRYQVNTASATFFQYTGCIFNASVYAGLNAGDVLKPAAVVNGTDPGPTASWSMYPLKIQLIRIN